MPEQKQNYAISLVVANATENHIIGDVAKHETNCHTTGALFARLLQTEGKCIHKLYANTLQARDSDIWKYDNVNKCVQIGWVFRKLTKYDDCNEKYNEDT